MPQPDDKFGAILARATAKPPAQTGGEPPKESAWAAVYGLLQKAFERLDAIEGRAPVAGAQGPAGRGIAALLIDRDANLVVTFSDGAIASLGRVVGQDGKDGRDGLDGRPGTDGKDGQSVAIADLLSTINAEIAKAVAALPPSKDGVDGRDGKDGSSVTIDDVAPLITAQVAKAVAALPVAKDGTPGRDGNDGKPGADGRDGRDGREGRGIVSAEVKDGDLVLTLSDATTINCGRVVGPQGPAGAEGKAGADGRDGKDGAPGADGKAGRDGKDGAPGKPGADGKDAVGAAPLDVEISDEAYPADIDARDLRDLRVRDLTLNGVTYQILCRG